MAAVFTMAVFMVAVFTAVSSVSISSSSSLREASPNRSLPLCCQANHSSVLTASHSVHYSGLLCNYGIVLTSVSGNEL